MDKKDLLALTIKVYKITLIFTIKDPLRYKIRDVANRILENFISLESVNGDNFFILNEIKKDVEVLDSYLEISKWQNWVSYFDILNLKNEYVKIKNSFSEIDIVKEVKETKKAKKEVKKEVKTEKKEVKTEEKSPEVKKE